MSNFGILTERQAEALRIFQRIWRTKHRSPTMRELSMELGNHYHNSGATHIEALIKKGYLARLDGNRGWRCTGPDWETRAICLLRQLKGRLADLKEIVLFLEEYDRDQNEERTLGNHD
jgi:SOS-response transcriptional repressor LexA